MLSITKNNMIDKKTIATDIHFIMRQLINTVIQQRILGAFSYVR